MKNNLFDESSVLIDCLMRKFSSITIINIDVIKYVFVDESIAQKIYDVMSIKSIKLVKKRMIRTYNDKKIKLLFMSFT